VHVHLLLRMHRTTRMITHVHRYMPVTFRDREPGAMNGTVIPLSGRGQGYPDPVVINGAFVDMYCR